MLARYLNEQLDLGLGKEIQIIRTVFPGRGHGASFDGPAPYGYEQIPLLCFSHAMPDHPELQCNRRLIVLRNPLDAIVSRYFHVTKHDPQESPASLIDFAQGRDGLQATIAYINAWAPHASSANVVTFEDMHNDAPRAFRAALDFLEIAFHETAFSKALHYSSFEYMKRTELENAPLLSGAVYAEYDQDTRRVRRGVVGGYINYFSQSQVELLIDAMHKQLTPDGSQLLKTRGILPA